MDVSVYPFGKEEIERLHVYRDNVESLVIEPEKREEMPTCFTTREKQ
jgi:hypothetical protein